MGFTSIITGVIVSLVSFASSSTGLLDKPMIDDHHKTPNNIAETIVINQGDYIADGKASCTLGYIGEGFAIAAAHCSNQGDSVYNIYGDHIGHYAFMDTKGNQDVAIIELNDNVVGQNIYSGDRITSIAELSNDDNLCQYGFTTKKIYCSPQFDEAYKGFMFAYNPTQHGDSGGPVWVEGKGLIGVISTMTKNNGTGVTEAWITADKYGVIAPMAESTSNRPGMN